MRIIEREEFLRLPYPVLYYKMECDGCIFGEQGIKTPDGNNMTDDFFYDGMEPYFSDNSSIEHWDIIEKMFNDSKLSIPLADFPSSRDGCFDDPDEYKFLIFEKDDLVKLINRLKEVHEATP